MSGKQCLPLSVLHKVALSSHVDTIRLVGISATLLNTTDADVETLQQIVVSTNRKPTDDLLRLVAKLEHNKMHSKPSNTV